MPWRLRWPWRRVPRSRRRAPRSSVPPSLRPARASLPGASTVSAVPQFSSFNDVELCDFQGPLCMNGFDGNGGLVKSYPITPGNAQDVNVTKLSNCGGTVTLSPRARSREGADSIPCSGASPLSRLLSKRTG
jgi:hypothetical protein